MITKSSQWSARLSMGQKSGGRRTFRRHTCRLTVGQQRSHLTDRLCDLDSTKMIRAVSLEPETTQGELEGRTSRQRSAPFDTPNSLMHWSGIVTVSPTISNAC